jgi:hypothetical protein
MISMPAGLMPQGLAQMPPPPPSDIYIRQTFTRIPDVPPGCRPPRR